MKPSTTSAWNAALIKRALVDSVIKLNPVTLWGNPVIFLTEVGAASVSIILARELTKGHFSAFTFQITAWLWFTNPLCKLLRSCYRFQKDARQGRRQLPEAHTLASIAPEAQRLDRRRFARAI